MNIIAAPKKISFMKQEKALKLSLCALPVLKSKKRNWINLFSSCANLLPVYILCYPFAAVVNKW